jgi:hypothetical protein
VGKTSANTATEGVEFRSFGLGAFTRSGNQPIIANRTSNNGIILELQKDGTQVGVIGTLSSNLYVGSLDTGIYFNNSTDSIYAINTTTSAGRDNAIDLGVSATRFKDLYLGGGLYVGGTGSSKQIRRLRRRNFYTYLSYFGWSNKYNNLFYSKWILYKNWKNGVLSNTIKC